LSAHVGVHILNSDSCYDVTFLTYVRSSLSFPADSYVTGTRRPLFKTDAAPETRGISSSISAGLLIHASCTELLPTIHSHGSKRQGAAIISLVLGAVGMAAVGW
jgi:hypothetical protein